MCAGAGETRNNRRRQYRRPNRSGRENSPEPTFADSRWDRHNLPDTRDRARVSLVSTGPSPPGRIERAAGFARVDDRQRSVRCRSIAGQFHPRRGELSPRCSGGRTDGAVLGWAKSLELNAISLGTRVQFPPPPLSLYMRLQATEGVRTRLTALIAKRVASHKGRPDFRQAATASVGPRPACATESATSLLPEYPDLAVVLAAWPELPEAVCAGIMAMVKAMGR
jgi:hypothetical protein